MKIVNVKDNLFFIWYFHFLWQELVHKMKSNDISVSIKTEKTSGELTIYILLEKQSPRGVL